MLQHTNNKNKHFHRFGGRSGFLVRRGGYGWPRRRHEQRNGRARYAISLLLLIFVTHPLLAQVPSLVPIKSVNADAAATIPARQPVPAAQTKRITVQDAVSIFLQQNLQLVAARFDIDTVEAEKLSARVRPNPSITIGSSGLPLKFNGPFLGEQTFAYNVAQDLELGGKREKRIAAANADSELARSQFEMVVWQMTNDVKKKFYAVLLAESLLNLARENQKTFADIVERTTQVFRSGEISGLDLQRLELEKFKFDTDLANSERDYEVAKRDLRLALGGDYRTMDVETEGSMEYYQDYDFSYADMRDKALAARPDLKVAKISEAVADANIILQNSQKVPNLTLMGGVNQAPLGTSNYNFGVGITLPVSDRNQTERAKALIDKQRAQNQQQIVTNQIMSDVDKAVVAFNIQKRRVALYRTGVLTKVNDIQTSTEYALKVGESSTLDLLDAIRTRRDTLAAFYQTVFDYYSSLLDLELATATPIVK
jgi:cobalt-zinc-cadmium efflux system outer membrane protein